MSSIVIPFSEKGFTCSCDIPGKEINKEMNNAMYSRIPFFMILLFHFSKFVAKTKKNRRHYIMTGGF